MENQKQIERDVQLFSGAIHMLANTFREQGREELQKECDRLKTELSCAEHRLQVLEKQRENEQSSDGCRWVAVSDEQPMEGEQVVVMTATGTWYMQTYIGGFTSEVAYWLRLSENV